MEITMEGLQQVVTDSVQAALKAVNTVKEEDRPGAAAAVGSNVNLRRYGPPRLGRAMKGLFSGFRESQSFERDLTQAADSLFAFKEDARAGDERDPFIEEFGAAKSLRSIVWPKDRHEMRDVLFEMGEKPMAKNLDRVDAAIKAMAEGTAGTSGLVPIQYLQDEFAYVLVSTTAVRQVPGIRSMPVNSNLVILPRESVAAGGATALEAGSLTAQDATLTQQTITVKKQYGYRQYANELLADATPAWLEFLANTLVRDVALVQDLEFLTGVGTTSHIQGLVGYTGVTVQGAGTLGYMGANGSTPSFDNVFDWIYALRAVNAEPDFLIGHPRVLNSFAKVKDSTGNYVLSNANGVNAPYLAGTGLPGANAKAVLAGSLPTWFSSQLSIAQTVGGSSDCTTLILGASNQVLILERQGIEIAYSEHVAFANDQSAARAIGRSAIAILQPSAVETVAGVRP